MPHDPHNPYDHLFSTHGLSDEELWDLQNKYLNMSEEDWDPNDTDADIAFSTLLSTAVAKPGSAWAAWKKRLHSGSEAPGS